VRQALDEGGCWFVRHAKGDHDVWRAPNGATIAVPVNIDSRHTANDILKEAGLPKQF
jgi:predicted RNA binding protein YcfA (HicA-like mRNA interferase family)